MHAYVYTNNAHVRKNPSVYKLHEHIQTWTYTIPGSRKLNLWSLSVCLFDSLSTCTCVSVFVCVCTYVYWVRVRVHVCMYVCMCVWCMSVCVYVTHTSSASSWGVLPTNDLGVQGASTCMYWNVCVMCKLCLCMSVCMFVFVWWYRSWNSTSVLCVWYGPEIQVVLTSTFILWHFPESESLHNKTLTKPIASSWVCRVSTEDLASWTTVWFTTVMMVLPLNSSLGDITCVYVSASVWVYSSSWSLERW